MLKTFYYPQIFQVKDGTPKLKKNSNSIKDASVLFEKEIPKENRWNNQPEMFTVFATKDGIGFDHEIPNGYSSYTYDPDTIRKFYEDVTLDWFIAQGLDQDERSLLSVNDLNLIRLTLKEVQGA